MFEAIFRAVLIGVLTMAFNLSGCGTTAIPGKTNVSGVVKLDGQPLGNGTVSFVPRDGKGETTSANILDGRFKAIVPSGEMRVEIRSPKVIGREKVFDKPDSPVIDKIKELVPEQYNSKSQLVISVGGENSVLDFNLETVKK